MGHNHTHIESHIEPNNKIRQKHSEEKMIEKKKT